MSDRAFRFSITITDESTDKVLAEEFVSFDPYSTDEYGNNETVLMAVEAWLKRAKYDAQQQALEAEQDSDENRADHDYKIRKAEFV